MNKEWVSYGDSENRFKNQGALVRYFIQGIPFAVTTIIMLWLFDNILLILFMSNITSLMSALIVTAIAIVLLLGVLNSVFAAALWDIRPRQTCTSFAGQGLLFTMMTYIFNPIFLITLLTFSISLLHEILVYVLAFLLLAFIGGYLGKNIAAEFEGVNEKREELASVHDRHVECPHCGAPAVAGPGTVDEQRGTHCSVCNRWFSVFDRGPVLE